MSGGRHHVLIVGASAAGAATARALRVSGHEGPVTLLGDEPELPYDRPPLSKEILSGAWDTERVVLHDRGDYESLGIALRLGATATRLDAVGRVVYLAGGETVPFDELVIATGVRARRLDGAGGLRNVHYLRTLADAAALRDTLSGRPRLVVIGGGFVGLEVAAAARAAGCAVDIVERSQVPLEARLGTEVGRRLRDLHRDRGTRIRAGQRVREICRHGDVLTGVRLTGGEVVDADAAVVGIGTVPCVEWLRGSGLGLTNGVDCDEGLRAAPHVWAAGDVANRRDPRTGMHRRFEHRSGANEHARIVAAGITGAALPPALPPFVWTDQYDARLQLFGVPRTGSTFRVVEGSLDEPPFVGLYHAGDRIDAVLAWNAARASVPYRRHLQAAYQEATRTPSVERKPSPC